MFISQNFFSEGNKNFFFRKKNLDKTIRRVRRASRLGRAKLSRRGWNRDNKPVLWKRNQRGGGGGVQSYCAGVQETPKKVLIQLQDAIGCREWIAGTSDSCTACIQSALCGFFFMKIPLRRLVQEGEEGVEKGLEKGDERRFSKN